ncbi:MAG: hypothetical protein ACOVQH_06185 [Burkholderiaceae bacterium]|jgi:hypothetical protein
MNKQYMMIAAAFVAGVIVGPTVRGWLMPTPAAAPGAPRPPA